MYRNSDNYTLDEIEQEEKLQADCNKTEKVNKHMQYIKNDAVARFNELEMEFIANHKVETQEQYLTMTEIFEFLKEKA
jgi:hypothetical protein